MLGYHINHTELISVVNQFYNAEILAEYVIRGNTAVLKCSIPSFVADFVSVDSWIDDHGKTYKVSDNYGKFLDAVPLNPICLYEMCEPDVLT